MEQKSKTADEIRAEKLRAVIEEANKDNKEALAALAEAEKTVPSVDAPQPKQKSILEKMKERQARLIKAQAEQERLERFQKIDRNITELKEEIGENGERIIVATTKAKNYYRLSSNGRYEFYDEAGKRLGKGTLKKEAMETLDLPPELEKVESKDIPAQIPVEEEVRLGRGPTRLEVKSTFIETVKSVPRKEVPIEAKPEVLMVPREEVPIIRRETIPISELEKMEDEFLKKTGESVDEYLKNSMLPTGIEYLEKKIIYIEKTRYEVDPNSTQTERINEFIKNSREALTILKERERIKKSQETAGNVVQLLIKEGDERQPLEEETTEPESKTSMAEVAPGPNAEADAKATLGETIVKNEGIIADATQELAEIERRIARAKIDSGEASITASATPEQASKEALEKDKVQNPFKYFVIENMSDAAFWCLFSKGKAEATLEDINRTCGESGREVKFFTSKLILPGKSNTVELSSNGFTLQLQNVEEVRGKGEDGKKGIFTSSPRAKYKLVNPNWEYFTGEDSLSYEEGQRLMRQRAEEYQKKQLALFESQKTDDEIRAEQLRRIIAEAKRSNAEALATLAAAEETAEPAVSEPIKTEADAKAVAIAKLNETIATAQIKLERNRVEREENRVKREALLRELAELKGKKPPEIATPSENQNPIRPIPDLDELESRLALLRSELEKTSKIRPFKRKNLKEQIAILEHRKENPFTYYLIGKLHPINFEILFDTNKEKLNLETLKSINNAMPQDGKDLKFWNLYKYIEDYTNNATNFSSNGFYLRLKNIKETPRDAMGVIELGNPKSKFELYRPDGSLEADDLDFETGNDLLYKKAEEYQTQQLDQFDFEMEIREMESLKTVGEKRGFLERKRKERINSIEMIMLDIKDKTETLRSGPLPLWKEQKIDEDLEAIRTSPLEYYTEKLNYSKELLSGEDSYLKRLETTIDEIKAINARYDRLLAGLEK